ncbi:MAG TPA: diheme cytochrome c-553 [Polyangia bacterium]
MKTQYTLTTLSASALVAVTFAAGGASLASPTAEKAARGEKSGDKSAQVARGEYLVKAVGCADCHTPHKLGPKGPEQDQARMLSGHPAEMVMPPAPAMPPGPWIGAVGATMTAWSGPWGTSFTANLTPDKETGLGGWTTRNFIETIRNARHQGRGRPLLPPMPFPAYVNFTDEDLSAIFAYLQSIPAVKNRVPAPLPPAPAPVKTAAR